MKEREARLTGLTGFGGAIDAALVSAFKFSGRASRSEYWYYFLFYYGAIFLLTLGVVHVQEIYGRDSQNSFLLSIGWLLVIVSLSIAAVSATVRRLHDANNSGWWMLIMFVPVIGHIALIAFTCNRGSKDGNRFGEVPRYYI